MPWLIASLTTWLFSQLFPNLFQAFWDFCTDFAMWLFGALLDFILSLLGTLDVSLDFMDVSKHLSLLTSSQLSTLSYIGTFQGLTIIYLAIVVKMTVSIIPFVGRLVK